MPPRAASGHRPMRVCSRASIGAIAGSSGVAGRDVVRPVEAQETELIPGTCEGVVVHSLA